MAKVEAAGARGATLRSRGGVGLLALLVAALTACGDGGEGRQGGVSRNEVITAESVDMSKPMPLVSETNLDNNINGILYMSILGTSWIDGELVYQTADENPMAIAKSYEFFGPDSASIRYHFRSDLRWSDGEPITAHDAVWTLEAQGDPATASPRQDYNREIREIIAEDDSTLVIHFTRRYPEIFFHTGGPLAPKHIYEDVELSQLRSHPHLLDPAGNLVTSGPFVVANWTRSQQVVLEPNPNFEPAPRLDRVVFRVIPEETTRMIELQTGRIDMTNVPYHFIEEIRGNPRLRIELQEKRSYEYIGYNPEANDFFADRDTRRALSLAVDVQALIDGLQISEFAAPAGGPYAPIFRNLYDPEGQPVLPYDTVEAKRILESKGWTMGTDGVLTRDGERFSFTIVTNGDNQRRVDVAQIIERQWRRIGVEARIQTMEFNTLMERLTNREYEAAIGGWGVGLSADLHQLWGDPDLPFNIVGYENPEVTRLFRQAVEQPTEEEAAAYWREAASIIVDDQPYTWLYYYDTPYGVNNRFQGIEINTLGQFQRAWEWHIQE